MQTEADKQLTKMAKAVLKHDSKTVVNDGVEYHYTCPANGWYNHQWLWDSCFHAIALSTFDTTAAKRELESLLAGQRKDGFLPSVILRDKSSRVANFVYSLFLFSDGISNLTQPPAVAIALERVFEATRDTECLKMMLPKVAAFFDYLRIERDPERSGLVSIIHPWETGIDSTPSFDELLHITAGTPSTLKVYRGFYGLIVRYWFWRWDIKKILKSQRFNVKHMLYNSIYAQGLRAISRMYKTLDDVGPSVLYAQYADAAESAIIERCWNKQDKIFYDVAHGKQIPVPTISSLFPLILETIPKHMSDHLVHNHLSNPDEFWTPYALATVPRNHRTFSPGDSKTVLWRGPVWINANWFLINALRAKGYDAVAEDLLESTKKVLLRNDTLYEFYNPLTGEGEGQPNLGWSALILDLLHWPKPKRAKTSQS